MSEESPPPYPYQTGQVVNGYVWTGTQWLPYQPPKNPWYNIGTWPIVLIAVLVGLMLLLAGGVFDDIADMFR